MKPLLKLLEGGVCPRHVIASLLLWAMATLFLGQLPALPPCCCAVRLSTVHLADNQVGCQPRSVDARTPTFSQNSSNPSATPPSAAFARLKGQHQKEGACSHSAAAAGPNRNHLSCLGNCTEGSAALRCSRCFADGHSNGRAAQDDIPCSYSSGSMHADRDTRYDVAEENRWSPTSSAAAVDDQMMQQRLKVAARIYASPALSEVLRLHNRRRTAEHAQRQARIQTCLRQERQRTQESQPQHRQQSGQHAGERQQDGRQRQPGQHQNNILELHKVINQLRNESHQLRQLRVGSAGVADNARKQKKESIARRSGCPLQAGTTPVASRRAAAHGTETDRNDPGLTVKSSEEWEAAAIVTEPPRVEGLRSSSYTKDCRRSGSNSPARESPSSANQKHSRSCALSQTHRSTARAGGVAEEVEAVKQVLPLARPIGCLLQQLQQYDWDRFSALVQLKCFLFKSSGDDVHRGETPASTSSNGDDNYDVVTNPREDGSDTTETAKTQLGGTHTKRSTQGAAADVQRLLNASLIVARVVRCAKCSNSLRMRRRETTNPQSHHDLQNRYGCRSGDVWHVLPASGFFVHSGGVLVTSLHVIAPSVEQYQQLHRHLHMAVDEQQQVEHEHRQLQLPIHELHQQQQNNQSGAKQELQHQVHCEVPHYNLVRPPTGRKELRQRRAAASPPYPCVVDALAKDDAEEQKGKEPQAEVFVVMDRLGRCWPVKRILAASPHHDLAVLEIDWEGFIQPGTLHAAARPSAPVAALPSAITTEAPPAAAAAASAREKPELIRRVQGARETAFQQQQEEKQNSTGQQQEDGQLQDERLQGQKDSQRRLCAHGEDREPEDDNAVPGTATRWKQLQEQGETGVRRVAWLQIEKRGVMPGRPILVCSNPSGRFFSVTCGIVSRLFLVRSCPHQCVRCCSSSASCWCHCPPRMRLAVTADFAQGSSGGAAVDAATGRVIGVTQSTSSLYCSRSAGMKEATTAFHLQHPQLQMVVKTCIPIGSLGLVIDEALSQQQALSLRRASNRFSNGKPAAAAAA